MSEALQVSLPLKEFLQIEQCPNEWRRLNLYWVHDEEVVFYVGQSFMAFHRVWRHFYDGFKGRSLLGRFIVCNWPISMRFIVELCSARDSRFEGVAHELNAAERLLIEQYTPCLNTTLNQSPAAIPSQYYSPYTSLKFSRHPKRFIQEAEQAIKTAQRKAWLAENKREN